MIQIRTIVWGIVLLLTVPVFAQVGIGTTVPNSLLDISSSNQAAPLNTDGILIPKIDEYPVTPPTIAQDGMLIYATGIGSVPQGFYYWNHGSLNWVSLASVASSDSDWFEEGTTIGPAAITDNIFTQGEVGIGTVSPNYGLDIAESTHDRGINLSYFRVAPTADIAGIYVETNDANAGNTSRGFYNYVRGSDGNKEGVYNRIEPTGAGTHVGTQNQVTGNTSGSFIGVNNILNSGATTATQTGYRNQISASSVQQIGLDNVLTAGASVYGIRNSITATGTVYGMENIFGLGTGDHFGVRNLFSSGSTGNRTGSFSNFSGAGTGIMTGHRVDISMNNIALSQGYATVLSGSNNANAMGFDALIQNTGTGIKHGLQVRNFGDNGTAYGVLSTLSGDGTTNKYGVRSNLSGTGAGVNYGAYNELSGTGNGLQYGVYNIIATNGIQDQYGTRNDLNNTSQGSRYGSYNRIAGTDAGGFGTKRGTYNTILVDGDAGDHYGTFNLLTGSGVGVQYGSYQSVAASGGNVQYGLYSVVSGNSGSNQYGSYQNVTNGGAGISYGSYNLLDGTGDGVLYGSYQEISNSGIQDHYGTYNSLEGNSTGARYGSYNLIGGGDGAGIGEKYGTYNEISIIGNATHYGTFNVLSGTGAGNKYGILVDVTGATGGTHYGVHATASTANGYAGYFDGNLIMNMGRADFTNATLDATPTTGSGILELGGNLRLDANEIITNTGNTLFLQFDNAGDLRVDNNSLMVDASANRVGIGTITPGYALDVVGDINTSGNIRQGAGAAYNYPDYVFESYFEGTSEFNPSYRLASLSDIESFLKENKHLPGVQNRAEVAKEGWNVSEGVRTNLEKVEELYLHVINLNKKNRSLTKENAALKVRLERLERKVFKEPTQL